MNKTYYPMGSVSSGTMRSQDLFESFGRFLLHTDKERFAAFRKEHIDCFAIEDYDDITNDQAISLNLAVEDLFTILGDYAGPYFYFGAHPGDGADYGFWFDAESFEDAVWSGEVMKVNDLSEVLDPEEHEYIAVVSDHGNVTLYDLNGEEVWSIV